MHDFPENFNFLGNRILVQITIKADCEKKYPFRRFNTYLHSPFKFLQILKLKLDVTYSPTLKFLNDRNLVSNVLLCYRKLGLK